MLNNENYVPWSSRLLRYAKSKPNGKLLVNSIKNGPYVRRIIREPDDPKSVPLVAESTHEQTDDELTNKEVKEMEADDQAIQTILMGLLEDIYAVVDSCDTAQEIWLRVEHMMKGSSIGVQEKKAKNKYFTEKIASNLKFLNNLQPKWQRDQNGYNAVHNVGNQNANQSGNGNVVATRDGGIGNGTNGNQIRCYNCRGLGHYARNCIVRPRRRDATYLQTQDIDEIEEVNANCILMENLQQASTSGTQSKAPVYDLDGSAKEDRNVIPVDSSLDPSGGEVETVKETRAFFESLYNNLVTKVENVNTVNRKIKETNADLTIELARYRGQEKSFEIDKTKFDELETSY
ncbi:retrovirus-related pol polyprotein from transposon TNT 1-94, partial [Tanacetum coccineum]